MITSKQKSTIRIKIGRGENAKQFEFRGDLSQEPILFEFDQGEAIVSDQDKSESPDLIKNQEKTGPEKQAIRQLENSLPGGQVLAPSDQDQDLNQDLTGNQGKTSQSKQPIVIKAIRRAEGFPAKQPLNPSDQDQDLNQDLTGSQGKTSQSKQPIVIKAIRRAEGFPESQSLAPSDQDQDLNQDLSGSQGKTSQSKQPIVIKAIRRAEGFPKSQSINPSDQDQDLNQDLTGNQGKTSQSKQPIVVKAIRRAEVLPAGQPLAPSNPDQDLNQELKKEGSENKLHDTKVSMQFPPSSTPSTQDEEKPVESDNRPESSTPRKHGDTRKLVAIQPEKKVVSVYESRIETQFSAEAKVHGKASNQLFFKLAWFNKDLHGSWRSLEAEHRIVKLKEILKMIVGPLAAMPGAKAIARNRIKGFFQRLADQYGTMVERVEVYFVYRGDQLMVRIAADKKFKADITVDALVKELGG